MGHTLSAISSRPNGYDARFVYWQRPSSFYFCVTVTFTDTGFVALIVTQITYQLFAIAPPQPGKPKK
jgi:hypothetical protein